MADDSAITVAKGGELVPGSLAEAKEIAIIYADSTFVPKDYQQKPGNVLVAMQMGAELGLKPLAALQNIAVVNGRPSLWGDAVLAVCRRHPEWGGMDESQSDTEATCTVMRYERTAGGVRKATVTRSFSKEDATRAKLWDKEGPWKQYPKRMLQMRARAFALRDAFADALKGIGFAEELQDVVEATVVSSSTEPSSPAAEAPKKGAAALKAKLGAKAQPAPAALPPEVQRFVAALDAATFVDDVSAIKRDIAEVWGDLDEASRAAVEDAGKRAVARIQGELKPTATDPHAGIGSRFD